MNSHKLSRKEIYEQRGNLKARKRYLEMGRRYARRLEVIETRYQEKLAKDINKYV